METNQTLTSVLSPSQFTVSTQPKSLPQDAATVTSLTTGPGAAGVVKAALTVLNADCQAAVAPVNQNQLGPYGSNGSCTHDCSYNQTWSWSADYRYINTNLLHAIASINVGGIYNTLFQPTQTWVSTDLPNYNTRVTGDLNSIIKVDAAIENAGGIATPDQTAQLVAAFDDASKALQSNLDEANQGLRAISNFVNQQIPNIRYLQTVSNDSQTTIKTDGAKTENNLVGQIACGAGDVRNSFNAMFADVAAKFVAMQNSFNAANAGFQSALEAVQLVAGVFLSLQTKSQLVSEYINQAQSYPSTSPLRLMHLNMAINVWNSFVAEATTDLAT